MEEKINPNQLSPKAKMIFDRQAKTLNDFKTCTAHEMVDQGGKHFDWWAFPVNYFSAGYGNKYAVDANTLKELESCPEFMSNLRGCGKELLRMHGWDIDASPPDRTIKKGSPKWSNDIYDLKTIDSLPNPIRLAKLIYSAFIFEDDKLYQGVMHMLAYITENNPAAKKDPPGFFGTVYKSLFDNINDIHGKGEKNYYRLPREKIIRLNPYTGNSEVKRTKFSFKDILCIGKGTHELFPNNIEEYEAQCIKYRVNKSKPPNPPIATTTSTQQQPLPAKDTTQIQVNNKETPNTTQPSQHPPVPNPPSAIPEQAAAATQENLFWGYPVPNTLITGDVNSQKFEPIPLPSSKAAPNEQQNGTTTSFPSNMPNKDTVVYLLEQFNKTYTKKGIHNFNLNDVNVMIEAARLYNGYGTAMTILKGKDANGKNIYVLNKKSDCFNYLIAKGWNPDKIKSSIALSEVFRYRTIDVLTEDKKKLTRGSRIKAWEPGRY